jgi:hypothetical protein
MQFNGDIDEDWPPFTPNFFNAFLDFEMNPLPV